MARKGAKRASVRARRTRCLAKKHVRASRLLFEGGALPQSTYGPQIWCIPPTSMKRARAAAAWTSGGCRTGMCSAILLSITKKLSQHLVHTRKSSPSILCFCATTLCKVRELRAPGRFCSDTSRERQENVDGFLSNVIAILLELGWKPLTATQWINDLEEKRTCDQSQTFDLVPINTDIERASMRCLWRAASSHRHGESLEVTSPDLMVLRRHLHSLRKTGSWR